MIINTNVAQKILKETIEEIYDEYFDAYFEKTREFKGVSSNYKVVLEHFLKIIARYNDDFQSGSWFGSIRNNYKPLYELCNKNSKKYRSGYVDDVKSDMDSIVSACKKEVLEANSMLSEDYLDKIIKENDITFENIIDCEWFKDKLYKFTIEDNKKFQWFQPGKMKVFFNDKTFRRK